MRVTLGFRMGLAVFLVMMSCPVWAQHVTPADREAIRTVVQQQLDAFRSDDAEAAFSFASPSIQEKFGTPEGFMNMVKSAYAPVYRPRHIVFKELRVIGGSLVQPVLLVGQTTCRSPRCIPCINSAMGYGKLMDAISNRLSRNRCRT